MWQSSKVNLIEAGSQTVVYEIQLHRIQGSIYTAFLSKGEETKR